MCTSLLHGFHTYISIMRTNATDSIYNYINIISFLEQIETGLFDADMRLCAVKDN